MANRTHTLKLTINKEITEHYKSTASGRVAKEKETVRKVKETTDIACTCGKTFDTEGEGMAHISKSRYNAGLKTQ